MIPFKIISVKKTCAMLNISIATLYRWESEGKLPFPKIKIGIGRTGKVGFRDIDVYDYVNRQIEEQAA